MYKHQNLNGYTRLTEVITTMYNITTSCLTRLCYDIMRM